MLASLLPWFVGSESAFAQNASPVVQATEEAPLDLPLDYRSPQQSVLLINLSSPKELETAVAACRVNKLAFEQGDSFNKHRNDYSKFHLIVGGTNCMDYWASRLPSITSNGSWPRGATSFCSAHSMVAIANTSTDSASRRVSFTHGNFGRCQAVRMFYSRGRRLSYPQAGSCRVMVISQLKYLM